MRFRNGWAGAVLATWNNQHLERLSPRGANFIRGREQELNSPDSSAYGG